MKNKLEEFLYNNMVDINNGDWDLLFAKAVSHDISPYTLQKVLHKANIQYKITGFSTGKIVFQLDNFNMYDLQRIAGSIYFGIDFDVVEDAKTNEYIKVSDPSRFEIYYDKINFINLLYTKMMLDLSYNDTSTYDKLFNIWYISGQGDSLFENLLEGRFDRNALPAYSLLTKNEINWG